MSNKYYQKHKEKLKKKKHVKDIKIFLKKKKEKSVSIIMDVIRIFLRNKSLIFFKDPMVIKFISWISH